VSFDALRTGAVVRYPYLWAREAAQGETDGRKFRPAAVGVLEKGSQCHFGP
jgi:hypothetical protein